MTLEKIEKISQLMEKVEAFLQTVNKDEYVREGFIIEFTSVEPQPYSEPPPSSITEEYVKLIEELSLEVHGAFITSDGQSSRLFYDIRNHGFTTRVLEKDSFGPLACSVRKNIYDWSIAYG